MTDRDLIRKLRDALGYILDDEGKLPRATTEAKKHILPAFDEANAKLAEPVAQAGELPTIPDGLIAALRGHFQIDEDDTICGVSREAVCVAADLLERFAAIAALRQPVPDAVRKLPDSWRKYAEAVGNPTYCGCATELESALAQQQAGAQGAVVAFRWVGNKGDLGPWKSGKPDNMEERRAAIYGATIEYAYSAPPAASAEAITWPTRLANHPTCDGSGDRIIGFRVSEGDPILGEYGLSEPLAWFRRVTIDRFQPATIPALREVTEDDVDAAMDERSEYWSSCTDAGVPGNERMRLHALESFARKAVRS